MSLASNLQSAFTRVATEFKAIRVLISGTGTGGVADLDTTATNLVAAINEVLALAGGTPITSLDDLTDVVITSPVTGHVLRYNGTNFVNVAGDTIFQPLDSDLTAIAALSTTSFGRGLLALADSAALTGQVATSSETVQGKIELATQAETDAGADDLRAITALKLQTRLAAYVAANAQPLDSDLTSIAALATTGYGRSFLTLANQAALMALLSTASATTQGIVELATDAETLTGTDTTRATTPANVKAATVALKAEILGAGVPAALDTLDELAAALGDDANFAATVTTALGNKQPLDADLTAIAALTTTTFGRALLTVADAAGGRTAIGAEVAGAAAAAQAASQPLDAELTALAGLVSAANRLPYFTGSGTAALTDLTAFGRSLVAATDAAAARVVLSTYSQAEIGDPNTNFVATFEAGLV